MPLRGVRGATVAEANTADAILEATRELLLAMVAANPTLQPEDVGSAIFTLTDDLDAAYPAQAARQLNWLQVPLMCSREIPVPGSLKRCVRVLLLWNTEVPQNEVQHVYLKEAVRLRPDLSLRKNHQPSDQGGC